MFGQYAGNRNDNVFNESAGRMPFFGQTEKESMQKLRSHSFASHAKGEYTPTSEWWETPEWESDPNEYRYESLGAAFEVHDDEGPVIDAHWDGPKVVIHRRGDPYPFPGSRIRASDIIVAGALGVAFLAGSAIASTFFRKDAKVPKIH